MSPKFSIILPTHNGADRILTAITSVNNQTFKDYELIIVCDSCTDGTADVCRNFFTFTNKQPPVKIIETDCGRDGLARNAGLDVATGEWILFIDDDDYFLHEYCFELLAEKVGRKNEDVLDFSFIWKNVGYKSPCKDEIFVMVWCRAWRRSFIGDKRFNSETYGSDRDFCKEYLIDNPDAKVEFWDCPMYYYNYLREGSLSWMEKRKTILDIIVTHYDEPWEIGRPFFDMLEHQLCADMDKITVTIVQDGNENALSWEKLLANYSYKINVITIRHSGVGAARNAGLAGTSSPWVMFCDFDDRLADSCSLSMMLENFPTDDYDIIWSKMVQQCKWFKGDIYLNCVDGVNFTDVAGKMYRRQVLEDNFILFNESEKYFCDQIFNTTLLAIVEPFRIASLTTTFYPYCKTFRPDSLRHSRVTIEDRLFHMHLMDEIIVNEMKDRGLEYEFGKYVAKAICRYYYEIFDPNDSEKPDKWPMDLITFYNNYRDVFKSISPVDLDPIRAETEVEAMNFIQTMYNEHRREYYLLNDDIPFKNWIEEMDRSMFEDVADPSVPYVISDPEDCVSSEKANPRVVVYCGTFDVYLNMVASLKSLLANVAVDKVYFLIEDDEFPYPLPDIVECINVKNQDYFPHDGPNFDNSWTWMCMMRAAFPSMFPQYDKILSLDVDIVINDNVEDLWDYDISDYYLAGVPERQRQKNASDPIYINFGVVMMNLKKLRDDNKQAEIIHLLNTNKIDCPEQGAYNRACAGHILPIPSDFNYTTFSHITDVAEKERIIHYAGQKFWRHYGMVKRYSNLSWYEVMEKQKQLKE